MCKQGPAEFLQAPVCLGGCGHGSPVVAFGRAGDFVRFDDFAVGHVDVFKMGEMRLPRVLAVGHVCLDVHDDGILELDGEVVFHGSRCRGAVEFHLDLWKALATDQGAEEQRRCLVHDLGDLERLMHALASWLAGLRIAGEDDLVFEGFHQAFILVALLKDVADRCLCEVSGGNEPLALSGYADVGGYWHDILHVKG